MLLLVLRLSVVTALLSVGECIVKDLRNPKKRRQCSLAQHVQANLFEMGAEPGHVAGEMEHLGLEKMTEKDHHDRFDKSCGVKHDRHGVDFMTMISTKHPKRIRTNANAPSDTIRSAEKSAPEVAVWIKGYPRSGTSTTLSMLSSASRVLADYSQPGDDTGAIEAQYLVGTKTDGELLESLSMSRTFALFEPCHDGDAYDPWLNKRGCGALLAAVSNCDFSHVENLWGWDNPHTTNANNREYTKEKAQNLCSASDVMAFKTVMDKHPLQDWQWLLKTRPQLHVLDVVRDPRGIWASWKTTPAFEADLADGKLGNLTDICDMFAKNIGFESDRVRRVVFERLVRKPEKETKRIFDFLGLPFGDDQLAWAQKTFNAEECPPHMPWFEGYTDCHENSDFNTWRWRTVLTPHEKDAFTNSPNCQKVSKAYGYTAS